MVDECECCGNGLKSNITVRKRTRAYAYKITRKSEARNARNVLECAVSNACDAFGECEVNILYVLERLVSYLGDGQTLIFRGDGMLTGVSVAVNRVSAGGIGFKAEVGKLGNILCLGNAVTVLTLIGHNALVAVIGRFSHFSALVVGDVLTFCGNITAFAALFVASVVIVNEKTVSVLFDRSTATVALYVTMIVCVNACTSVLICLHQLAAAVGAINVTCVVCLRLACGVSLCGDNSLSCKYLLANRAT